MNAVLAHHDLSQATPTFEQQVRPLLPRLRARALQLTRSEADADDLLQDAVLAAWRFRDHYVPGSNLRAWLGRILTNTFINGYRRARRERALLERARVSGVADNGFGASAASDPAEVGLCDELTRGLSALPPDYREVMLSVAIEELTYGETAAALGCPIGTVMSRLHRARQRLRASLPSYASA